MSNPQTLNDLNKMPVKKALMMMRVVWFALLAGPILFAALIGFFILPKQTQPPNLSPVLVWAHIILFAVAIPVTFLIRSSIFTRAEADGGILPSKYYVGNVVFWAGCEGPAFFGIVVAMMRGTFYPTIILVGLAIGLQVLTFPTGGNLRDSGNS
jgi:hypothetical protein